MKNRILFIWYEKITNAVNKAGGGEESRIRLMRFKESSILLMICKIIAHFVDHQQKNHELCHLRAKITNFVSLLREGIVNFVSHLESRILLTGCGKIACLVN